jgi:hypothetical protein
MAMLRGDSIAVQLKRYSQAQERSSNEEVFVPRRCGFCSEVNLLVDSATGSPIQMYRLHNRALPFPDFEDVNPV